ncbi:pseudouridine synthase [Candidatus Cardinium hertigii]|uniref:Pseudouridine synthase n=1 Tax=Candidatus Cardinium hertigii TaxID=247481 RepID=A0A2Z3L772_9BACT|nr:pseudouridine synthase [Candidatus Cardinium hertigii]AWN81483.1 Ribosomal large subunit pseudouridine synthase B [Candidatus Cardinium hertigii]
MNIERSLLFMSACSLPLIRLNKFISNAGICARRAADRLIASGAITVNGHPVRTVGTKITLSAVVAYKGTILQAAKPTYILLNKPKGYVSTLQDPEGRKTVVDLISKRYCAERVYPVGRLDYDTMGLLLLTNDGALAQQLAHPSSQVQKYYHVILDRAIQADHYHSIQQGILLEDGFTKVDTLTIAVDNPRQLNVALHMGKNRIVRRIFEHFGYTIQKLDRIGYAHLTKKNIPRGKWIFLDLQAVAKLKSLS